MIPSFAARRTQGGTSLIEVLVTIVILAISLLALAALQMRLQANETESYQRASALTLLEDMSSRISANRPNAASYVTGTANPIGTGMTSCPAVSGTSTRSAIDVAQWCQALLGAAELDTASNKVGAVIGARGCIQQLSASEYLVTVAWQGMVPLPQPVNAPACGKNSYDDGKACTNDGCRRFVTTRIGIGTL